ncbi:hypothetical protein BDV40DRAFT_128844 [Aspergillus tamarii]|uniref:Carrier domain-containing protein n=1 Tax=Aspergillus tamarii TaxID=41984 RepID=A0A5N6V9Z8_ASPTM|nr:hypothetical protein BDV40DRAFT_128844 [Aspergillus tamarii]
MAAHSIVDILRRAANHREHRGVCAYSPGMLAISSFTRLSYKELDALASSNSVLLRRVRVDSECPVILLHFDSHLDNIIWFWSALYAGYIPAISTDLPRNEEHRIRHLRYLNELLGRPICLTRESLQDSFPRQASLRAMGVESLGTQTTKAENIGAPPNSGGRHPALLMLTSGSTGLPKAVCLTHKQILVSLEGKSSALPVYGSDNPFLNWIRLDHVGSLIEIHLHAVFVGCDQVHVPPEDVISQPASFLELIHRHRIVTTFAPNFFLTELRSCLENLCEEDGRFDLRCLRYIVSGGEAIVVSTCARVSQLLTQHGAPHTVIVPGFGMTETCAGCIYNLNFPEYDFRNGNEFASLGKCVPGVEVRMVSMSANGSLVRAGEVGHLELRGPLIFSTYYNNLSATAEAFSSDGWFRTGDTGYLGANGGINLSGRTKDLITVNGVKYIPHELETALDEARIPGIVPGDVICFAHRPQGADTERPYIIYKHSYYFDDAKARYETMTAISHRIMMITNIRPCILPLHAIERTSLGKLPRSALQHGVASGQYRMAHTANDELIRKHRQTMWKPPRSSIEQAIVEELADLLGLSRDDIGIDTDLLELGLTSVTLIQFQHRLHAKMVLNGMITLATIMAHHTVQSLAEACQQHQQYIPAVALQTKGGKAPIWLVHPAAGEALIFINLAKLINDRPVYAFRARGLVPGETYFTSIDECVRTYYDAVKKLQPRGPYAILGYSYGAMLAFELAKTLEKEGDQVQFLASLNRPPYVSAPLQEVKWTDCLLNISYFLGLLSRASFRDLLPQLHGVPKKEATIRLIEIADPARLAALGLDKYRLEQWINVAFSLQDIGRNYDPQGSVAHMDVFHCDPLEFLNVTPQVWQQRLASWETFSRQKINFFHVPGEHFTVLGPVNVQTFLKRLNEALALRGM